MRTPHTSCRRGKTVEVKLKDGVRIVAKFLERTGKFVLLEGYKIAVGDIKSFKIVHKMALIKRGA